MRIKRLRNLFFLNLANLAFPSKRIRPLIIKWGGVKIIDYKSVFIGKNVIIDTNNPHLITIEPKVYITHNCTILTHFLDTSKKKTTFNFGRVKLEENCFLGCNTIICAPITVGENSIVAAGSVVIKDVPPNELWGGVPAKFIKKLEFT